MGEQPEGRERRGERGNSLVGNGEFLKSQKGINNRGEIEKRGGGVWRGKRFKNEKKKRKRDKNINLYC